MVRSRPGATYPSGEPGPVAMMWLMGHAPVCAPGSMTNQGYVEGYAYGRWSLR